MHQGIGMTHLQLITDAGHTLTAALGLDEDDTIGTVGTIDGSGSIFQHRDALHLIHVEVVELFLTLLRVLIDEVVDHVKRSRVGITTDILTTDIGSRRREHHGITSLTDGDGGVLTGTTGRWHTHVHGGRDTDEGLREGAHGKVFQFFGVDDLHGARHVLRFQGSISHDDHIVERVGIFLQHDSHIVGELGNGLRDKSDVADS